MGSSITQTALAEFIGCSKTQIGRVLQALYRPTLPVDRRSAMLVLAWAELQKRHGFAGRVAVQLLNEMHHEWLFLATGRDRRAWAVFVETDTESFSLSALNERHLAALLEGFPLALLLSLHDVYRAASSQFAQIQKSSRRIAA